MLSEEALIVLAALGACGLLVLGVLELVWPCRSRHPVRPRRPALARSRARSPRAHRAGASAAPGVDPARAPAPRRSPPLPIEAPVATAAVPDPPSEVLEPIDAPTPVTLVDECFALQQAGRHAEVVELASAALRGANHGHRPTGAHATAALWSVVALAHQGLGEHDEARVALQAAVAAAPAADRPTYERQLGTLAEGVARRLLAEAAQHPRGDSPECLETARAAVTWLEHGVAAGPADSALAELHLGARAALWRACERVVTALLQRQEFRPARRLLHDALADPHFPSERLDAFRELYTSTFSGEIGQLTAHAIRSVQDARDADALRAVQRAETLLATLSDEALSAERREEVDRRLWWIYSRLGERRLDCREFEAALEPLVHAVGFDVGAERHERTRLLLERALEGAPDREAAIVHCDRLWARLHGARETLASGDLAGGIFEPQGR
jgi:tetratricopeptide (TPR) repeat protein